MKYLYLNNIKKNTAYAEICIVRCCTNLHIDNEFLHHHLKLEFSLVLRVLRIIIAACRLFRSRKTM